MNVTSEFSNFPLLKTILYLSPAKFEFLKKSMFTMHPNDGATNVGEDSHSVLLVLMI